MSEKMRMDCRMPGCSNYCLVDKIPPSHSSWQCPECEAFEFEQHVETMAREDEARRAMLGRDTP